MATGVAWSTPATALSSASFSHYFSIGIRVFFPSNQQLLVTLLQRKQETFCSEYSRPTFDFPRGGKAAESAFCSEPLEALSLLSLVSHLVQCTFWQATLAKYVRQPTVTV